MQTIRLARHAMATRFELVLHGENPMKLRAVGEEALDEVARLENQLSLYRPDSEVAQVNARAAREAVRVTPEVFALLEHAQRLSAETAGAFDITVGPLVRCWGFMGGQRCASPDAPDGGWTAPSGVPTAEAVAEARARVGMHFVQLDSVNRTVHFAREGVTLDLGAIGKGYAVECAARILRENGMTSALIHGGTSTVCAIGQPPDADSWKVAVDPTAELARRFLTRDEGSAFESKRAGSESGAPATITISLMDESLSVSAASGRQFESGGKFFGHVIDPRTGQPTEAALLAGVVLPSATETDALSTALLTSGRAGHAHIARLRSGIRTFLLTSESGGPRLETHGAFGLA